MDNMFFLPTGGSQPASLPSDGGGLPTCTPRRRQQRACPAQAAAAAASLNGRNRRDVRCSKSIEGQKEYFTPQIYKKEKIKEEKYIKWQYN
jgi:hypothetical protein